MPTNRRVIYRPPMRETESKYASYAWVGIILIVAVNVAFSSIYFSNTFPMSEGWFVNYAELILRGKVPYRDFYYYLPPFTLFLDVIFWKLSFGLLIVFRAWYLAERILIYVLAYRLLCRYFNWKYAAIACAISEILCTADVFDFFGDYNQNTVLLGVFLAYCAANYADAETFKKRQKSLFWAGIVLGLMFLCKQTIVVAACVVYVPALLINCYLRKDKKWFRYFIPVILGALIPVGIFGVYLIATGALMPFIEQVFLHVSGKGSILDIILKYPLSAMVHKNKWAMAIILLLVVLMAKDKENRKRNRYLAGLVLALVLMSAAEFDFVKYAGAFVSSWKYVLLLVVAALPALTLIVLNKKQQIENYSFKFTLAASLWAATFLLGTIVSNETLQSIYDVGQFYTIENWFNIVLFYFQFLFIGYCVAKRKCADGKNYDALAMIACGGLAVCYAYLMAGGSNIIPSLSMRITLPLILCFFFSEFSKSKPMRWLKYLIYMLCAALITVCCAQKAVEAYPWWGCTNEPRWQKTYKVDIPEMRGITFSKTDQQMYENLTKLIRENSDEDDLIFGYPYLKIYNILCDRYESNFVPVIWYDVVGDEYVEQTLEEIQEHPPEIVVWYHIPNALEVNESVYRDGKPLVQRKIEEYFASKLPQDYDLLGEENGVKVYKLR